MKLIWPLSCGAVLLISGPLQAGEVVGAASQACYTHYLGAADDDAFYRAPMQTREHVLDCIELVVRTGHMPADASVAALSRRIDAAEAADSRAYAFQLARKLGHKPTTEDYKAALAEGLARAAGLPPTSGPPVLPHSATSVAAVNAAHAGIRATLRDPDSAKFDARDGEAYSLNEDGSLYAVCGAVNAKNGFGGYSGEQMWIYVIPKNTFYTQETGATAAMVTADCSGNIHSSRQATRHSSNHAHS